MVQNELTHYGVMGMKWGVRKDRGIVSTQKRRKPIGTMDGDGLTTKYKPPKNAKYAKGESSKDKKQSVKDMSDAELRQKLNRLQMEKQYDQLTKEEVNKGKKKADKILKTAVTFASVTTTAITIYNNLEKLGKIAKDISKKTPTVLKDRNPIKV